jgi:hypothetical protein
VPTLGRVRWGAILFVAIDVLLVIARGEGRLAVHQPWLILGPVLLVGLLVYGLGWLDDANGPGDD